jgi:hypothetical protein
MTNKEMIDEWLKHNKPKVDTTSPLNRNTISVDFKGNIKRKPTIRKTTLVKNIINSSNNTTQ